MNDMHEHESWPIHFTGVGRLASAQAATWRARQKPGGPMCGCVWPQVLKCRVWQREPIHSCASASVTLVCCSAATGSVALCHPGATRPLLASRRPVSRARESQQSQQSQHECRSKQQPSNCCAALRTHHAHTCTNWTYPGVGASRFVALSQRQPCLASTHYNFALLPIPPLHSPIEPLSLLLIRAHSPPCQPDR